MKRSYLLYSMSVIVGRALPDVRDGLKPIHRRILYAMKELGLTPDKPYRKSATIVGEVMGKYHPHGDAAIYETLVRMAQDFSQRYTLIDGHGNFGSVDGDSPAAMRYTEARMTRLTTELLADIDKETVDFGPNFDASLKEPLVLPARFPNLLVNGSSGIAVGMATNIPPHNLGEVIDACIAFIDNPDISIGELMQFIKGPDFPTYGLILGTDGIRSSYETGRGTIKVRAKAEIETSPGGKSRIIVTELPYQVNKANLVQDIAELARERKIDGIADLRDESDRSGMRIVIEVRRDANPNIVLNQLYKHTKLQDTFGVIMLVLVEGKPRIVNLKQAIAHYISHQEDVIRRRTQYDLKKAEERAHILEGLRIALANLDAVIQLIRQSRTPEVAKAGLMKDFGLSERQAQAILDMRLQRLTGLERDKIEEEYKEVARLIESLRAILADEAKVLDVIKKELSEIKEKYADQRRTRIVPDEGDFEAEDLIAEEDVVVTLTRGGYIKRLPATTYKNQRRGGKGVAALTTREDDHVEHLCVASTHDFILFFTDKGKVYSIKAYDIPEATRQARGTAIVNLLSLSPGETIKAIIPVDEFSPDRYVIMVTKKGFAKKTRLSEYATGRRSGIVAIALEEGDDLVETKLTDGSQEVILATAGGLALRFPEDDVRPTGRVSRGVKAIQLVPGDRLIGMDIVRPDSDLLVVTRKGYGKRTPLSEYRVQGRAGKGIKTLNVTDRNGELAVVKVVQEQNELMIMSAGGTVIRMEVREVPVMGRDTQGVRLMRTDPDDHVAAVAQVSVTGE
ncbi:MAG TPA: DNA gyrase subunit A [Firmicutes bacterium]|nr:DNA gyrase subunit A [Bacillota bacterium]